MKTTGLKVMEGRDFEITDSAFSSKGINMIITQSFEKLMGQGSAIGKKMHNDGDTTMATVVGVINDYIYGYMYGTPDPVAFVCTAPKNTSVMYLRLNQQSDTRFSLAVIGSVLKKYNPAYPFDYTFVDDQFNNLFLGEALISRLSRVFAALAIVISCLGLFGLAIYMAERRTKEIGVRKVLGASVSGIAALLSKDFLKLVLISCLVAFPVAWWAMYKWLLGYPYRIGISWWVFAAAGVTAMVIAVITISFQSVKAAVANPVKTLRTE